MSLIKNQILPNSKIHQHICVINKRIGEKKNFLPFGSQCSDPVNNFLAARLDVLCCIFHNDREIISIIICKIIAKWIITSQCNIHLHELNTSQVGISKQPAVY